MTTEFSQFTIHQTLNEKKSHTVNTDVDDDAVQAISMKIDLGNNMRGISVEDKYEFNYRSFLLLPFTATMATMALILYADDLGRMLYNALLFLVCLAIFIYGIINKKKTLKKCVNQILGYQNDTEINLFDFEVRPYAGLLLLVCIMCSSVLEVVTRVHWIRTSVVTALLPVIMHFEFLILHKTVKCEKEIEEQKKSIFKKYKNAKNIEYQIEQRLKDWKESKKLTDKWDRKFCKTYDRRVELFCIFVIVLLVHYGGGAILDWHTWRENDTAIAIVITAYFVYDAVFGTFLIYALNTIYLHYKFPAIIMDELAAPINAETTDDLIGWWQLRNFYANSIVKMYTSALGLLVGIVTLCSLVLGGYLVHSILTIQNLLDIQIVEMTIYLIYAIAMTFLLVSNATNYHSSQLSHIKMIRRESMALRKYAGDNVFSIKNNGELELRKYENDIQQSVANQMIQDVQNGSDTIQVLGMSIDAKFTVMLRAALGTLFIAVISISFAK